MTERDQPLRVAVVGLGVRGRQWASVVDASPEAELAAAVEVRPGAGSEDVPVFGSLREAAAATPLDAAILATPPAAHREGVEEAAELGVAVLCEKPLAEGLDEAVSTVRVAEAAGVPLLVGMNFRYLPVSVELRRRISEGALGLPMFATLEYIRNRDGTRPDLNDHPLTMPHPMLLEQSIHHLDLLRYVYDREVVTVSASTWNPVTSGYAGDACVAAHLVMQGDLHVSYLGTWVSGTNRLDFRWRTDLQRGVLVQRRQFDDLAVAEPIPGAERSGPLFDEETEPLRPVALLAATPFVDDTAALLRQLHAAAQGDRSAGPSASDHLLTLALVHACIGSAETGLSVDLAAFAAEHGIG